MSLLSVITKNELNNKRIGWQHWARSDPTRAEEGRRLARARAFCLHQSMRPSIRTMNNSKIDMKWRMVLFFK